MRCSEQIYSSYETFKGGAQLVKVLQEKWIGGNKKMTFLVNPWKYIGSSGSTFLKGCQKICEFEVPEKFCIF